MSQETIKVGFSYGVLSDNLEKQANKQGFTLGKKASEFEEDKEAINTLRFGSIAIPDSMADKLHTRLHKCVIKNLKKLKVTKKDDVPKEKAI